MIEPRSVGGEREYRWRVWARPTCSRASLPADEAVNGVAVGKFPKDSRSPCAWQGSRSVV